MKVVRTVTEIAQQYASDWYTIQPLYRLESRLAEHIENAIREALRDTRNNKKTIYEQRLYWTWSSMWARCTNPNDRGYKNYGARGITVCERWQSFSNFRIDMGDRPERGMLERRDNNGNYEPNNCYWSSRIEQNSNRRNNIYVVLDGHRITLKEACRRKGLDYRPVHKRIRVRGWNVERALNTPIGIGNSHAHA